MRSASIASTAFAAFLVTAAPALTEEQVAIPGRGGVTLKALMLKPAGAGPFPAIVALHGCGGLGSPREPVSARHRDWGARLQAAGFLVVFPESFASRGLGSQCNVRDRDVRSKDRAYDAFATAEWLAARPDVQRNRIGLLGWSNGGTTVLSAVRDIRRPKGVDFRTAVAFYPGCRTMAKQDFRPRIPVTILHGLADNWTPAAPCQSLPGVTFVGYPDAHHDFDYPNMPLRTRKAAFSADGSGVVTIGTNPAARDAAISRAMAIFRGM
ncbi:MAG: dienelactone hydrolase family protein [Beijerinckiaceae bacterium]|nr:dienelactone hydrolase family protein [Beijerinckiaceae bacterium]MCZ8298885.1 dienelactone hydrolase family protein [Beijerinckiaceae bacterium]